MNVSRSLTCLVCMLVCACQVKADLFNTELIDLSGGYSSGPFGIATKQTVYDFDAYFTSVTTATLHVEGSSWNGNSPGPFKMDTQLFFTIDLEGSVSSTSYEFSKKGDSVPFAIDIPLTFDGSILDGQGEILMTLDTFGVFDHMGSTVNSVSLFFDALTSGIPGDANGDGKVDGLDYLGWAGRYGETEPPVLTQMEGDFVDDGVIDGLDYLVWASNYGMGPNDSVTVPESGTLAMFSVCTGIVTLVRRRY